MKKYKEAITVIRKGNIGIMPTDTLYGLVGSARSKKAVTAIYKLRKRSPNKPLIVLIGDTNDLKLFGIRPSQSETRIIKRFWPGPISIILPCPHKKYTYLHRGKSSIAFRLPKPLWLRNIVKKTGPLVAPSANPEGKVPALTIKEARSYFGDRVSFYLDRGKSGIKASKLIEIVGNSYRIIRSE